MMRFQSKDNAKGFKNQNTPYARLNVCDLREMKLMPKFASKIGLDTGIAWSQAMHILRGCSNGNGMPPPGAKKVCETLTVLVLTLCEPFLL